MAHEFTPENKLATPSMKIKREAVRQAYARQFAALIRPFQQE